MPVTIREAAYDAEVGPLVRRVIDLCKARGIGCVMSFDLSDQQHPDFRCTTAIGVLVKPMSTAADLLMHETVRVSK